MMPKGWRDDVERHANMCGITGYPRVTRTRPLIRRLLAACPLIAARTTATENPVDC